MALGATITGLALSMALSKFASIDQEPYAILSPGEWLACAGGVLRNMPDELHGGYLAAIFLFAASGFVALAWPQGRKALAASAAMPLALLAAAAVQFAFMTSLDHVHQSDYGHYVFASVFLWQGACVAFAVSQWAAVVPAESVHVRRLPYGLVALLCVVTMARYGRVGEQVVRKALDDRAGKFTAETLDARCTHVIGDYWRVWPTVFHANLRLADQGSSRVVWGITQRSRPTMRCWSRVPESDTRIASILGDEGNAWAFAEHYRLPPLVELGRGQRIRVLTPTQPLAARWPMVPPR